MNSKLCYMFSRKRALFCKCQLNGLLLLLPFALLMYIAHLFLFFQSFSYDVMQKEVFSHDEFPTSFSFFFSCLIQWSQKRYFSLKTSVEKGYCSGTARSWAVSVCPVLSIIKSVFRRLYCLLCLCEFILLINRISFFILFVCFLPSQGY